MNFINKTSLNFLLGFVAILVISFTVMIGVNAYDENQKAQAIACAEKGTC